ncbi:hypothetical protein AB0F81_06805 [Actinoplanes sp. NPDC024001]|uniref:hypothetical protein n=1 Tax=Actinoplanes sp. NPDC024001 TaxID=3154598 RepID=UPI0033F6126B
MREGLRHASDAVASLDPAKRKEFVLAIVDHVLEVIPHQERGSVAARELTDLMRTS